MILPFFRLKTKKYVFCISGKRNEYSTVCHVHPAPPGRRKHFGRNLQGKVVSVPPPGRARVNFFEEIFAGRGRLGAWKWLL